ncbi:interferon-induced protein 44-like [Mercenaria mercenaria]|uniref:interferon-induced protein 44-like n=1 Tax=Mercenaria mercenaria TaxID=6596 RepID=UPI00234F3849|nr:interferon-induced protein 44-like [Mercenaria mercenaria]
MGVKLTNKDMDQLEKWIGTGPKTFTLLYAITRDGCKPKAFHDKCDYQGPTITVLYNTNGSVYGGYNPTSWNSDRNQYTCCTDAFLFQLYYNGSPKANKFSLKSDRYQYAIENNSNCGPTFGYTDLRTFTDTVSRSDSYFSLNVKSKFNEDYDMQGLSAEEIYNDDWNVTELEVYKVAYEERKVRTPWRNVGQWNEKFLEELKKDVLSFKPVADLDISAARILMIGPVGAGKSSFYNTIESIFRGNITQRARSGSAEQSLTTCYVPYSVNVPSGGSLNFRLCDTRGLEESHGLDVHECSYLLDGNIADYYQFNPTSPITPKVQGFKTHPTTEDTVHCAVFVIDATTLDVLSTKVMEKIKGFQNLMNQRDIPQMVLLTKVDKLCKDVQSDISFVYQSQIVEEHVDKASQLLGLPRTNILPVKNYEKELRLDENTSILALLSLRQILYFAEDYMYNLRERKNLVQN